MEGNRIKELRKIKGLTQMDLAKLTGIAVTTLRLYEGNKRQPHIGILQKIAAALGCSVFELVGDEEVLWLGEDPAGRVVVASPEYLSALKEIEEAFNSLNATGIGEAVKRVRELAYIPTYRRQASQEAAADHLSARAGQDAPVEETPTERKETPPEADV